MSLLDFAGYEDTYPCRTLTLTVLIISFLTFFNPASGQKNSTDSHKDSSVKTKSQKFYDSVYYKFSRNRFTHFLYDLAFVDKRSGVRPDSMQVINSEAPFNEYRGRIIRKISVKVLDPFGTSVDDTSARCKTDAARALNSLHVNTRDFIVRRNILFEKGQVLDPVVLADNERVLRSLPSLDNAKILVSRPDPSTDSVDLTVVVKDVWSIGFDIPLITPNQLKYRIYDGNFLGLGDRFTIKMSTELYRAPFFRFDGVSYTYTNIGGSFINGTFEYSQDDIGNQSIMIDFERPFLTNNTVWAGGTNVVWARNALLIENDKVIVSYLKDENLWLGLSFLLNKQNNPSRIVVTEAVYRRVYTSRPEIFPDSNKSFYDHVRVLTGITWCKNNYYLTDYVTEMGKTENLPYGHKIQLTFGPDYSNFYQRFYTGLSVSFGRYFQKVGYFQAYVKVGGFLNQNSFEDGVLKANVQYFTPLVDFKNNRYKFRTYIASDYRYGFNFLTNNPDYYDANLDFRVNKVAEQNIFWGTETLSTWLATLVFTPWDFYGFRFTLTGIIEGGLIADKDQPLLNSSFFTGFGAGVMIKNDNLIFPTFVIAGYFYPMLTGGEKMFQGILTSTTNYNFYDFNVTAPYEESMGN